MRLWGPRNSLLFPKYTPLVHTQEGSKSNSLFFSADHAHLVQGMEASLYAHAMGPSNSSLFPNHTL